MKLSKNYFFGDIAVKVISFLAIPILTRLLSPADYGIVQVFNSYVGILAIVLPLYTFSAIGRYYYEEKDDFGEFLGCSLIMTGTIVLFFSIVVMFYRENFQNLLNLQENLVPLLLWATLIDILTSVYLQITVPRKKSVEYSLVNISLAILGVSLSIYLILHMTATRYMGRIYGQLIAGTLISIFYIYRISQLTKFKCYWKHIKYIVSFSIPLMFFPLGNYVLGYVDRIMINKIVDSASAGLYSAGYNIALLVVSVSSALLMSFAPYWMKNRNANNFEKNNYLVKNIFKIVIASSFALILFSNEIVVVMLPSNYSSAVSVIPVVAIGYVFWAMFNIYAWHIGYIKKNMYISLAAVLGGILNIIMNLIYIPQYGYIAGAYTTAVSFFFIFLFTWYAAKYILKQTVTPLWTIGGSLSLFLVYLGMYWFVLQNLGINIYAAIAVKSVIFFSFVFLMFYSFIRNYLLFKR